MIRPTGELKETWGGGRLARQVPFPNSLPHAYRTAGWGLSSVLLLGCCPNVFVCREGINIEVEVAIESVPHPTREQSLCSPQSGQSLSGDSLEGTSDRCSVTGVPAECRGQHSSELGDP